jgi:D-glycero-D-manno-heptose 1,7-bisphosphate phosphatase
VKQRALFLDRDGVINENRPDYVRRWADLQLLPGALTALQRLAQTEWAIVVVTNQSGVGRGLIPPARAEAINERLRDSVAVAGGRIDAVFMCPHAPWSGCDCRKPAPGLLLRAAAEMDLDLHRSVLIGDALSDIAAARAAGLCRAMLVRTGRGEEQLALAAATGVQPLVFVDLLAAVQALLGEEASAQR